MLRKLAPETSWGLRESSDWLRGLGSEARGHGQHLQKYLVTGRKKQRRQAELERRLREGMYLICFVPGNKTPILI